MELVGSPLGFPKAGTRCFVCWFQAWSFTSCSTEAPLVLLLPEPAPPPSLILVNNHTSGTQGQKEARSGQPPTPVSMPCSRAAGGGERLWNGMQIQSPNLTMHPLAMHSGNSHFLHIKGGFYCYLSKL